MVENFLAAQIYFFASENNFPNRDYIFTVENFFTIENFLYVFTAVDCCFHF